MNPLDYLLSEHDHFSIKEFSCAVKIMDNKKPFRINNNCNEEEIHKIKEDLFCCLVLTVSSTHFSNYNIEKLYIKVIELLDIGVDIDFIKNPESNEKPDTAHYLFLTSSDTIMNAFIKIYQNHKDNTEIDRENTDMIMKSFSDIFTNIEKTSNQASSQYEAVSLHSKLAQEHKEELTESQSIDSTPNRLSHLRKTDIKPFDLQKYKDSYDASVEKSGDSGEIGIVYN